MESWHPRLVHFPIALLLAAVAIDLAAVAFRRPGWRAVSLVNLALGSVGAALAVLTGLQAESVARHSFEIWRVMERHKRLGLGLLAGCLVLLAWRLVRRDRQAMPEQVVYLTAALLLAMAVIYQAHLGGVLVYDLGVGGSFGVTP